MESNKRHQLNNLTRYQFTSLMPNRLTSFFLLFSLPSFYSYSIVLFNFMSLTHSLLHTLYVCLQFSKMTTPIPDYSNSLIYSLIHSANQSTFIYSPLT